MRDMRDISFKEVFGSIGIALLFLIILYIGASLWDNAHDDKLWNDGKCICGGNWVYEQAVGHYLSTGYIYHCDTCNEMIEITERK